MPEGQYIFKWTGDSWEPFDFSQLNGLSRPDKEFPAKPWVLLVHGFTADLTSMSTIARRLTKAKYLCLGFQYRSDQSITSNGRILCQLLLNQNWIVTRPPEKPPFTIVAHSMGGLVSRAIFLDARGFEVARIKELGRGIVSLGTPHDGTLTSASNAKRLMKVVL